MRGLPQKQNARRADKIRLCGHLGRYKKIVKKTYIIYNKFYQLKKKNTNMIGKKLKTHMKLNFQMITNLLLSIMVRVE